METQQTDRLELAAHFVNSTNSPIFLTGKAGTGKTTFLRKLSELTHKRFVVLAPTGIAALHAKGVTLHSQFLLPFGTFLPTREPEGNFSNCGNFFTQYTLGRRHPLNMARKKVLKAVDLLIIDEVSMLRADILDAIDYRMRSVKRNFDEPFGGVQVLMIGDLFQLPPIVKDYEWQVLNKFYKSMHFFEAQAIRQSGMVYLELDKIFRQKDEKFITILNHLRDNEANEEDISFLNSFYKTEEEIKNLQDTIIITTHNYKAEEHNQKELAALKTKAYTFEAVIEKDFPESLYPLPKVLELKEGAQIMFIKNDTSGYSEYFNGKMATVKKIDGDEITVILADSRVEYTLRKEVWENKKYVVNEDSKELEEEVIGTFEQYPIKLAWAVTVHKSQGLTFDKAIIDVGQAFAPGQVYVALSRLRGLEGLTLRTRIQPHVINSDRDVVNFTHGTQDQEPLEKLLSIHQKKYMAKLLESTFDFGEILQAITTFNKDVSGTLEFEDAEMQKAIPDIYEGILQEGENTYKFQRQLLHILHLNEEDKLLDRLEKGSSYYAKLLQESLRKLLVHAGEVERFTRSKSYLEGISEIELMVYKKLSEVKKVTFLIPAILNGEEIGKMEKVSQELIHLRLSLAQDAKQAAKDNPKFASNKTGRKKKGKGEAKFKREKGETYEITYELSQSGKSISEIASERELAESTIRGHLAKGITEGKVSIHSHLSQKEIEELGNLIQSKNGDIVLVRQEFPTKYDYGTLKMVANHLANLEKE
ncbi:helix-turn-helix domain-containing protein [Aquiflexum gelatinilyticum]|uniref:Helix-turn-helix domain-containing protein n=1 Tax=Aquiflexum gelatinilyticum TaxID=2961943 RepID=A0A9X2P4D1_9BACT|nr:helix-turn-helix domain-containing protein [Aquiflexum gelatinilyticum]MCR9016104.1 helix-turn-helix domain-containing protein [Aquiflexum gelatinilyticum]